MSRVIPKDGDLLLDRLQRESFDYFLKEVNPANGLIADKTQDDWPASLTGQHRTPETASRSKADWGRSRPRRRDPHGGPTSDDSASRVLATGPVVKRDERSFIRFDASSARDTFVTVSISIRELSLVPFHRGRELESDAFVELC